MSEKLVKVTTTIMNLAEFANYTTRLGDFNQALEIALKKPIDVKKVIECKTPLIKIAIDDNIGICPMLPKELVVKFNKLYQSVEKSLPVREFTIRLFRYLVLKKEDKDVSN